MLSDNHITSKGAVMVAGLYAKNNSLQELQL